MSDYVIVQADLPGHGSENIGVLLYDPVGGYGQRFRRDLDEVIDDPEDREYLEHLPGYFQQLAEEKGSGLLDWLEENASNAIQVSDRESVLVDRFDATLRRLYDRYVAPKVLPFRTHLPQFTLRAAAGRFGERMEVEPEGWVEAPEGLRLLPDMFVAHVTGRSMEPRIPDGSLCVFRGGEALAGSRQGKLVLVEHYGETGENRYTIKRYRSTRRQSGEHARITLEPLNPEFEAWELEEGSSIKVIGEFIQVLE